MDVLKEAFGSMIAADAYLKENVLNDIQLNFMPFCLNEETMFDGCQTKESTLT